MARFTNRLGANAWWLASCMIVNPTPAAASPKLTEAASACNGPFATNTSIQ